MASRKEQKEQARAQRLAQEQAAAAKAQRTRRLQMFGGAIVAAVVIVVVVIVIATSGGGSGGGSSGLAKGSQATQTASTVNTLLHGIPQSGTTLGDSAAPVTMTYLGDLECPICRDFTLDSLPQFISNYVRTGKVKMQYKSFCTATGCPANQQVFNTQQVAAYAAGKQGLFWDYAEIFYHEQGTEDTGYVNDDYLTGLAKQVHGLNMAKWKTDRGDPSLLSQVESEDSTAPKKYDATGTPWVVMAGKKGEEVVDNGNLPSYSDLTAAVKAVS